MSSSSVFLQLSSSKKLNSKNSTRNLSLQNQGTCTSSGCICNQGFGGIDCSLKICSNDCSKNGDCDFTNGKCSCYEGFKGEDCSIKYCKDDCNNNGICSEDGVCKCNEGYEGSYCQESKSIIKIILFKSEKCKNNCNNNGVCNVETGECKCNKNFINNDCSKQVCLNNCNNKGICLFESNAVSQSLLSKRLLTTIKTKYRKQSNSLINSVLEKEYCKCQNNYYGENCEYKKCDKECLNKGTCNKNTGKCDCINSFSGDYCQTISCKNNCNYNGKCLNNGECKCFDGFSGNDCSITNCKNNCNYNGVCTNGKCLCVNGYFGEDCSKSL